MAFAAPAPGITVATDVAYGSSGTTRLAMDVYKPAMAAGAKAPALVFFNRATGADRSGRFYASWARAAASKGIVGILPDLRSGSEAADFRILLSYLEQHGAEHGIDSIAVYAGSGNVYTAFPVVEDPALTSIKAAVMYYGSANVTQFRLDLPVLYVRAGLDRPPVNEAIASLATLAIAQNAPLTLLNYAGGHHAFEIVDDTDTTRQVIDDDARVRQDGRRRRRTRRRCGRRCRKRPPPATSRPGNSRRRPPRLPRWSRRGRTMRGCAWPTGKRCSGTASSGPRAPSSTSCAARAWVLATSACPPPARACRKGIPGARSRG